jgi:outer membrane protein assembly factor BamB
MGFLKKRLIILLPIIFLSGCLPSIIKIKVLNDPLPYEMFGKIPQRDFYNPVTISDSVIEKWETSVNGGFTNSSFTNYDSSIFINDLSGWVTCININTGKHLGQIKNKGAVYSSPIVTKTLVIFPLVVSNDNYTDLFYYNFIKGKVDSKIKIDGKVLSQLIKIKDGVIFNTEDGKVFKYDNYGKRIWETKTKVRCHSSPSMSNNTIFFGNDDGEIVAIDPEYGKILYKKKIGSPFSGSSTISNNVAYIGNTDGILYAVKLSSGDVLWKFNSGSEIMDVPVMNNNNIYLANMSGKLFSIDKKSGKQNWATEIGGVINATPLLTNNYLIVPNLDSQIDFVDVSTGKITKRIKLEGHAKLSPVIIKNKLLIGYDNGIIRAYEIQ